MLIKRFFKKDYLEIFYQKKKLKIIKSTLSSSSKFNFQTTINNKRGNIYIKSTSRNIFCTLMDVQKKKVETSCSLRVPQYDNEFNERDNLYKRGMLLGELFKNKTLELGFRKVAIYLDCGFIKGHKGFIRGFGKKRVKISFIELSKGYPHNGCRPSKIRRKKVRTKFRR